ncbi:MAG: glycosyltransferase [Moraxellaceae bacterium]|jgi:glycosyltransferase involved in cell wall biosynthesis|nr:glycosyltransferase [Moraxellaceae bacterium]
MPRLLIVSTVPATLRAFLLPFARHYRALGWQVDAAARDIDSLPELKQEFDACHALPLSRNPRDIGTLLRAPAAIRALVARGNYDIVHVHTPVAAFLVRFALRTLSPRPRVVYTAHGFHFHRNGRPLANSVFRFAERLAAPWCDALVTINREDFDGARSAGFDTRVEYMPGIGVDTKRWTPTAVTADAIAAVRRELGLDERDVLFLMVAEFNPGKRHRDVLAAMQLLGHGDIHVAFAGDGPLRQPLQEQAAALGLADRLHFLGFRRDIPVLARASRAVLLPSEREGLPRSLLEALSLGVPIIGADTRGISELTEGCGRKHAVGDAAGLAAAMQELAQDEREAEALGERGRARMVADYDEQVVIGLHDKLYSDLLGKR